MLPGRGSKLPPEKRVALFLRPKAVKQNERYPILELSEFLLLEYSYCLQEGFSINEKLIKQEG